jgi:hypothetical protein
MFSPTPIFNLPERNESPKCTAASDWLWLVSLTLLRNKDPRNLQLRSGHEEPSS